MVVAFSRVGLGVHYVSDLLGGTILGAAWVIATTAVFSGPGRRRGRSRPGPVARPRG
jgi:undecaprenyl-diphosphatase